VSATPGAAPDDTRGDPSRLHVDPADYRLNRRFFQRLVKLCRPYWTREGAWRSWLTLAAICALGVGGVLSGAGLTYVVRDQTNALVAKDAGAFWSLLALATAYALARFAANTLGSYTSTRLNLHWRRWLTTYLVDEYLARRTYYEIAADQKLDNPDQRIQEEVGPFCEVISNIPQRLMFTALDMGVQGLILMSISMPLFWFVAGFAVFKFFVLLWVYRPTIRQNFDVTVAEADLRYGILHVRDHAETVAFYRGEYAERAHIVRRLDTTIGKNLKKKLYEILVVFSTMRMFYLVWGVLPFLFLAPLFLAGKIAYGVIGQGVASATALLESLSVLTDFIPTVTAAAPKLIRLAQIQEKFEELGRARDGTLEVPRLKFETGSAVVLDKVSVQTPGGEQQLVNELSLTVAEGQHLIIVGRTGVGKSSLLRVMAGLWTRGKGRIVMPPSEQMLFLPQRPYMILADLRSQLLYPRGHTDLSDAELQAILERVSLPELTAKHGGFDAVKDWGRVLSLGEQQRIAFARVLIAKPRYVFLDEATSAVDVETEGLLYGLLERSGATFISVGHRPSLVDFHALALRLSALGVWELLPTKAMPSATTPREAAASIST
jgi:vitamin B12/bleomycin/antimicrobial peptide transport system ATP-binding/permease protein